MFMLNLSGGRVKGINNRIEAIKNQLTAPEMGTGEAAYNQQLQMMEWNQILRLLNNLSNNRFHNKHKERRKRHLQK